MKKLTESIKDVATFVDNEKTDLDSIKEDLLNMGFICISSKIHEVADPDNYDIDDKDNQGDLYGFIDWWKQGHTEKERDENLEQELKNSGYLFFKARGMFEGLAEMSFMVMPLKPSTDEGEDDSGFDYENFDDLKDFGQSLTNKYSQDSVLIQEPQFEGGSAYYMDGNGKPVDAMDEICFDTAKVLDAYASTLADRTDNKKGGFTYEGFHAKYDNDDKEDLAKRKSILKKSKHIPSYDFSDETKEFFESIYRESIQGK